MKHNAHHPTQVRFEAEWIEKQHVDSRGEWNPDADEYSATYHATKEDAERAAIEASKKAGQCEWIAVSEQHYIRHEWVNVRRWTGDWDGLAEETFVDHSEEIVKAWRACGSRRLT